MKPLICRIARPLAATSAQQTGWRVRHVKSCQHCRASLESVTSLEARLRTETPPCDEALCVSIMEKVRLAPPVAERRSSLNPWLLGGTGLAAALAVIIVITTSTKPSTELQTAAPAMVTPPKTVFVPSPLADPHSLARMIHQQELMQRDARKLGAHLRQHVILFQAGE